MAVFSGRRKPVRRAGRIEKMDTEPLFCRTIKRTSGLVRQTAGSASLRCGLLPRILSLDRTGFVCNERRSGFSP
jgi:hypothetical protein